MNCPLVNLSILLAKACGEDMVLTPTKLLRVALIPRLVILLLITVGLLVTLESSIRAATSKAAPLRAGS